MALYFFFSVSLIPVYHHRIWYFPVMGIHVSKERGAFHEGEMDEKIKGGTDTPFRAMMYKDYSLTNIYIYIHICLSKNNLTLYEYRFLSIGQIKYLVCFYKKTAYCKM